MQAPADGAAGARLEGCALSGSFQNNTFVDSIYGIYIDDSWGWTSAVRHFTITHNSFERLTAGGVLTYGAAFRIDQLSDNQFVGITRAVTHDPGTRAVAVSTGLLQLGEVRRNQFIGNDCGVLLDIPDPYNSPGPPADFGTPDDPGNNVFRCNSALNGTGADLAIVGNPNWAGGTVHIVGNAWDHNPPTVLSADPTPNGCDINATRLSNTTLEVAGSSLAAPACRADRVPGQ
jgi:hypothetical protein